MALRNLPAVQPPKRLQPKRCVLVHWQAYEQQAARATAAQERARATEAELATRSVEVQALQARPPVTRSCCSGHFADVLNSTELLGRHTSHQCLSWQHPAERRVCDAC